MIKTPAVNTSALVTCPMAQHNQTGRKGETLAVSYFTCRGYNVLETNWRTRYWEIDIIATKDPFIHFIEVKTRTSLRFGYPEESVKTKKFSNLVKAAEEYLYLNPGWKRVQFDILSITIYQDKPSYFLIEDVYF